MVLQSESLNSLNPVIFSISPETDTTYLRFSEDSIEQDEGYSSHDKGNYSDMNHIKDFSELLRRIFKDIPGVYDNIEWQTS